MAYSFPIVGNMLPPKTDTRNPKPEIGFPKWAMQRTSASATKDACVPKPEMLRTPTSGEPASDISLILSTISDTGYFCLLMIYREEPGRAVSGEAAPGEQAPTGAAWPGSSLSARFRCRPVVCQARDASARHAGMGMIRKEGERVILRGPRIAASEEGLHLDHGADDSDKIC